MGLSEVNETEGLIISFQDEIFRFEIKMDDFGLVDVSQGRQQLRHVVAEGGLGVGGGLRQPVEQGRTEQSVMKLFSTNQWSFLWLQFLSLFFWVRSKLCL